MWRMAISEERKGDWNEKEENMQVRPFVDGIADIVSHISVPILYRCHSVVEAAGRHIIPIDASPISVPG